MFRQTPAQTAQRSLEALNRVIRQSECLDWWIVRPTAPERFLRLRLARTSTNEVLARDFFIRLGRDPELLAKRAGLLYRLWRSQRPKTG